MKATNNENKIINPEFLIKHLWDSVEKLELIGCIKEAQTLLEKIVAFSNYQDIQALQKLTKIYEQEEDKETLSQLWKKALYYTLLEKNDEQFLTILNKTINLNSNNIIDIQSVISLYAKSHHLYSKRKIKKKEESSTFKICFLSTSYTDNNNIHLIENLTLNNHEDDVDITCYFIDEEEELKKDNITNFHYLESFNCKVLKQKELTSNVERLNKTFEFIEDENFDCLIYLAPQNSSILNFLISLKASAYQIAIYTEKTLIQNEIDLALLQKEPLILNKCPYYILQEGHFSEDIFYIIKQDYLTRIKNKTESKRSDKNSTAKKKQSSKVKDKNNDKDKKKKNKSDKLTSNLFNNIKELAQHKEEHPLQAVTSLNNEIQTENKNSYKRYDFILSDTTSTAISKEEINSFWHRQSLSDCKITDLNQDIKENVEVQEKEDSLSPKDLITAIKKLQENKANEALDIILNLENRKTKIKDLYFIKALCYSSLEQYYEALNAVQSELGYFPDNQQALKLLDDINNTLQNINKN